MLIDVKSLTAAILVLNFITLSRSSNQSSNNSASVDTKDNSGVQLFENDEKRENNYGQDKKTRVNSTVGHSVSKIPELEAYASGIIEPKAELNVTVANGKIIEPKGITGTRRENGSSGIERNAESIGNASVSNGHLVENKHIINNSRGVESSRVLEHNIERIGNVNESKAINGGSRVANESRFVENGAQPIQSVTVVTRNIIEPKVVVNGTTAETSGFDNTKELHGGQKRDDAFAQKNDKELFEGLSTTISNTLINNTNDKDARAELNAQEFDEDKYLTIRDIPILPPLPIMFRAFVPLVIPPLERIGVEPVPPPAFHISDRLPIYDAESPEESSTVVSDMDTSQRVQNVMKSLISDIFGGMFRLPPPHHLNASEAAKNSSDAESSEDSKLVNLQGQQFLMKSKMTHLRGKNGRFSLRFMSLRPLERDMLTEFEEPLNINEKHAFNHDEASPTPIQKGNIEAKIETASKENSFLDKRIPHELESNDEMRIIVRTGASDAEKINAHTRKQELVKSGGDQKHLALFTLNDTSRNNSKANSSSILPSGSAGSKEESSNLKQTAGYDIEKSTEGRLHAEESQLKMIQNYRSFLDPIIPIYNVKNSEDGSSEVRLRDVPLEGDVSVAPIVAKPSSSVASVSPSIVKVKEVPLSATNAEKVERSAAVTKETPPLPDVEKISQSDTSVKKVSSPIKAAPLVPSNKKMSEMVLKVPLVVSNVSAVSPMSVKGDDHPYEEEGGHPKSIVLEKPSSFTNNSKKSNTANEMLNNDEDQKASILHGVSSNVESVSKYSEPRVPENGRQVANNSSEKGIIEPVQEPLPISGGEKILEVGFKVKVDKLGERKISQGINTEKPKLTTVTALKGDIEKK